MPYGEAEVRPQESDMIRLLPFAVEGVLLVFCLLDVILTDEFRVRNLSKWAWVVLIIVVPIVGGIAWLIGGRPLKEQRSTVPWPSRTAGYPEYERPDHLRPRPPDDNPEFLASLKKDNSDHERILRAWEDDLRRREERLRDGEGSGAEPTDR